MRTIPLLVVAALAAGAAAPADAAQQPRPMQPSLTAPLGSTKGSLVEETTERLQVFAGDAYDDEMG